VGADVHQREAGAFALGFNRDDVLIFLGADLEFDVVAVRAVTGQLLGVLVPPGPVHVHVEVARSTALENAAVFLELVFVEGNEFGGRVVGLILQGNDFYPVTEARDVDVGTLAVAGIFLLEVSTGIDGKAGIGDVRILLT